MNVWVFSLTKKQMTLRLHIRWGLVFFLLSIASANLSAQSQLTEEKRSSLRHLLKQDCGSCHGMRLTGGLGPELTSDTMSKLGAKNIFTVVKYGRPGTAMPPWRAILNDNEIEFIAEQLVVGVEE